jgi:hypothetical protein
MITKRKMPGHTCYLGFGVPDADALVTAPAKPNVQAVVDGQRDHGRNGPATVRVQNPSELIFANAETVDLAPARNLFST